VRPAKYYLEHIFFSRFHADAAAIRRGQLNVSISEGKMNDSRDFSVLAQPPTRRQMLVGTTAVLAGLVFDPLSALAHIEDGVSRIAESIHQEPVFKANPKRVYEALTDEKKFEKVTQLSAAIQSGAALGNKPTQIANFPRRCAVLRIATDGHCSSRTGDRGWSETSPRAV
jgi:hypothetical protein